MFYSPLVKKACNLLFNAHKDDVDKGGYPYVFHPFFLATQMETESETCVALLHDLIEDHGDEYTFDTLIEEGFNDEIIDAIKLMTHPENVSYMDYVKKIGENPIARKVKIADLNHNLDSSRIDGQITKKRDLYLEALAYLKSIK